MNSDTNIAAWMIAGGRLAPTVAVERERAHLIALASARQALAGPSMTSRIGATLAAFRSPRIEAQPACCAA